MNTNTAIKQTNDINNPAITPLSVNRAVLRPQLTDIQLHNLSASLTTVSKSDFESDRWDITIDVSRQYKSLSYPPLLAVSDKQLLKATVLETLLEFGSCNHALRIISDASVIFDFLSSRNLTIETSRTATVEMFISYLESISKNDSQRNSVIRTYERLFLTCLEYGFTESSRIVDFSFRFREEKNAKRAPDKVVYDAVTKYIFDLNYPMPIVIRCALMILRLVPNRISEVLSMGLDCISYPADGVFSILIETQKETPRHVPKVVSYYFQIDGIVEQIFYTVIKAQQKDVLCRTVSPLHQNYLFYSYDRRRVLTAGDVNDYLAALISNNSICDSSGALAKMTSHDFRHISIGERLRSNIVSAELTRIEANHGSIEQTIAYGYQSVHDEAEHLRAITDQVFDRARSSANEKGTPQELAPKKYDRLESQSYTRIIPCYGLCTNTNCKPQFEQCVYCSKYSPNAEYLEYFEAAKVLIENKCNILRERNGDPKALDFNARRLQAILQWIGLIQNISSQNRKKAQAV